MYMNNFWLKIINYTEISINQATIHVTQIFILAYRYRIIRDIIYLFFLLHSIYHWSYRSQFDVLLLINAIKQWCNPRSPPCRLSFHEWEEDFKHIRCDPQNTHRYNYLMLICFHPIELHIPVIKAQLSKNKISSPPKKSLVFKPKPTFIIY